MSLARELSTLPRDAGVLRGSDPRLADETVVLSAHHDHFGIGEPDAVINVGVSGPGVVKKAIDRALDSNPDLDLGQISEIIKKTSYKVTRVGELIGREVADSLRVPFGVVDLSLAPTPNVGDSVGEIFQSLGLANIGVPGSTVARAIRAAA